MFGVKTRVRLSLLLKLQVLIAVLLGAISLSVPMEPSPLRPPGKKPTSSNGYHILHLGYSFPLGIDLAYEECGEIIWGMSVSRNSADNVYIEQDQQYYNIDLLMFTGKLGYRSWSYRFSPGIEYAAYIVLRPAYGMWKATTQGLFGSTSTFKGNLYSLGTEIDNHIDLNHIVLSATGGLSVNLLTADGASASSNTFVLPYFEVSLGLSF